MSIVPSQFGGGEIQDVHEQPAMLEATTRAEIDIQIATAKRYPRSPARFLQEACSMVAVSPEIAAACRYRLPARKGGNSQPIEGYSVRLAEIVAACWGNLRIQGRIIDDDGRMLTAQGVGIDLERNLAYSVEIKRGVTTKDGRRFSDDMVRTTALAAIAIATRNVTFKLVPGAFTGVVSDHAIAVALGDEKTLPDRLASALKWFANRGVREFEVLAILGVKGKADVTLDHLLELQGYRTAIMDGVATAEDIFRPRPTASADARPVKDRVLDRLSPPTQETQEDAPWSLDEPGADDDPEKGA
jgi:hypothetical protein